MPHPSTPGAEPVTLIASGTLLKGELSFDTAARILGRVEGRITTAGRLEIGPGAQCKAHIEGAHVIIEGTVEGDIIARDRLELRATACITGSITAGALVVAEGASIKGPCAVGAATPGSPSPASPVGAERPLPARPAPSSGHVTPTAPTGVVTRPAHADDLDGAIAGLESKLAGLSKARALNGTHTGAPAL